MFSVFIAFVFQDDSAIKSMGIALGFGVLFDAFVVRMTLIPALTKLFGKASWYLPKWLGAVLPNIDVEGKALEEDNHHDTSSEKGHVNDKNNEYARQDKDNYVYQNDKRNHNRNYNDEDYNRSVHLDNHHDQHHRQHHYDNQRDDIDYESLYTQDGDHTHHDERNYNDRHYQDNYDRNDDYHDSNFDKTTNLYKELTDSNIDQDVLFKALMLYARENNKGVYDRYNRSSQHRHDDELRD